MILNSGALMGRHGVAQQGLYTVVALIARYHCSDKLYNR